MLGKPKYKLFEKVCFEFDNDIKIGYIYVVDKYGTYEDYTDISYDILVEEENILYKHIKEEYIKFADDIYILIILENARKLIN